MIGNGRQIVSLHTYQGVQLYQFVDSDLISLSWTRESNDVSRCEIVVPSTVDVNAVPDITPWLHWISVWDDTGQILHWTGPIQKTTMTREVMTVSARDIGSLFTRTRCPITKKWDIAWPVTIAEELVTAMIELHGLSVNPVVQPVRPNQYDERYSFEVLADDVMLESVINDLVRLGLRWTIVSGVPVLGALPKQPIAALVDTDFVGGGMTLIRDGSTTFNDVLLRGADSLSRAKVPMAKLALQTIVNIDNMFGVSNVDRAVKQYVSYTAKMRDSISLPDNAVLHPNVPLTIDQLIPSTRVTVEAFGVLMLMELTGIDVALSADSTTVAVRMTSVNDELPELVQIQDRASISGGK